MTKVPVETVPMIGRLYLTLTPTDGGRVRLGLSATPPSVDGALAALLVQGRLAQGLALDVELASHPADDPDVKALQSAHLVATADIVDKATVALSAGPRTADVAVPASAGLKAGDVVIASPTKRVAGYRMVDAVATSPTIVSVAFDAPALALGQARTLPVKLIRLAI